MPISQKRPQRTAFLSGDGDAPTNEAALRQLFLIDFVAYDAADCRTADRSDGAAARKNGPCDATNTGAYRGVLILRRHSGTTRQADYRNKRTQCKPLHRFHFGIPLFQ